MSTRRLCPDPGFAKRIEKYRIGERMVAGVICPMITLSLSLSLCPPPQYHFFLCAIFYNSVHPISIFDILKKT